MNQFHYEIEINVDKNRFIDETIYGKWVPVEYAGRIKTFSTWDEAKNQAWLWFGHSISYRIIKVEKIETETRTVV